MAEAQGLELVARVSPGCPQVVVGDESRFRQVVVNLLSNAVKFTFSGEVVLLARAGVVEVDGESRLRTVVEVRDTGIGIPADQISRLFQPFSQITSSENRSHGGTGLGLAISRSLARTMSGDLTVTSDVGVGSTFTFTALLGVVPTPGPSPSRNAAGPVAGSRVLVVDDNASSRAMLHELLESWGLTAIEVASGLEALQLLSDGDGVDVVVIDLEMPGMDGLELAVALRRLPDARRAPVILLAGLHRRTSPVDLSSVQAVVTKPVRSGVLLGKLRDALAPPAAAADAVPAAGASRAAGRSRQLRVLLVEDNIVNQRVGRLMLDKLGHDVDLAGDGQEAVTAVRAKRYDVVLMDLQMPRVDGLEATRRAEHSDDQHPYIVAMTANAYQDDVKACQAAGMNDFLSKPVRVDDLAAALARVPDLAADAPRGGPDQGAVHT
jgi:CheY-like chemotaxis protein/anti-sigma regulatory factor (Ser/Thr protein kinase)